MNKERFFKTCDEELTKRIKELPGLENLSTVYSKHAFVLMIYASFEGFVYKIIQNFFDLLKSESSRGVFLNAHYGFCLHLYNKQILDKNSFKTIWGKFKFFKSGTFKKDKDLLIDTNDNLGYDVLKYLLFLVNISEYKEINTKFYSRTFKEAKEEKHTRTYLFYKDIINQLLEKRNDIAYGNSKIFEEKFLTEEMVKKFSTGVNVVLRQLKDDLEEIVDNEAYLLRN